MVRQTGQVNLNLQKLYFLPSVNRFSDEQWFIVHNLHQIFNVWQLDEWKRHQRNAILYDKKGGRWMLYYLSDAEEDDILEGISWNESFGVKMDRINYE